MCRATAAAATTVLLASSLASTATAAEPPDPRLEVRGCEAPDTLGAAIRVELAASGAATPRQVTIVCLGGARVLVVVFGDGALPPSAREIDLPDVTADARVRSIAIATGELVRGAPAGPVAPPATPSPATPSPPITPPIAATSPTPTPPIGALGPAPVVVQVVAPPPRDGTKIAPWSLGASLHARAFAAPATTFLGPRVELDAPLGRAPVRLRVASDLAFASADTDLGDASLTAWTGSAAVLVSGRAEGVRLDAGPFVEAGGAFASGVSDGEARVTDGASAIASVGAEVVVAARIGDGLTPFLAIDGGGALAGLAVDVDGRRVLALAGPFVGARLGIAFGP